jgi:hypothetical protein
MISNIQVYEHTATGTFYATCDSSKYGRCTQWGKTADDASERLREFVTTCWQEDWPEILQEEVENKPIQCQNCGDLEHLWQDCPFMTEQEWEERKVENKPT